MSTTFTPVTLFIAGLGAGLVAGGASCAAVQGGLLAGAVTRPTPPAGAAAGERGAEPDDSSSDAVARQAESRGRPLPLRDGLADQVAPVGLFLAGKLVSHTALGALLGAAGSLLAPSPRAQAVLLVAAAVLMAMFALDLVGVRAVGRLTPRPAVALLRLLRRGSRSPIPLMPVLLGLATVALPCGITLSMELVAATSGSPIAGAAVMAGFVAGTAPLFTLSGRTAMPQHPHRPGTPADRHRCPVRRRGRMDPRLRAARRRLDRPRGRAPAPGAASAAPTAVRSPAVPPAALQRLTIEVGDSTYAPSRLSARAGVTTALVLRTRNATGCTRAFTIPALGLQHILPATGDTAIDLGRPRAGTLRFSCAMGMAGGTIDFTAVRGSGTQHQRPERQVITVTRNPD